MAFKGVLIVILLGTVLLQLNAEEVSFESLKGCLRRTGLQPKEILTINHRNGRCSVDCATKQTTVLTYFQEDGSPCQVAEHHCVSGKCQPKSVNYTGSSLRFLDLEIIDAKVPDLDQSANGDTDAFVVVSMALEKLPLYNKDDVLCHTFIVQDSDRPVWRFECKDIPIPKDAFIKFSVFDADPARAEFVGSVVYGIEYLKQYNDIIINVPLFKVQSSHEEVGSLRIRPFVSNPNLREVEST